MASASLSRDGIERLAAALRGLRDFRPTAEQWLLSFSLVVSFVAYFPVTRVYFISDDFVDMVKIADRGWLHFFVAPFGGHMIFTRNVEVILMNALFGVRHPEAYGWLALLTHLLNVGLFFRVVRRFTGSAPLSALGAAAWGTCPVISDSIGWYSVYGQLLCTAFVLLWLGDAAKLDVEHRSVTPRVAGKWAALSFLAATCFGGGIALSAAFPLVAVILFGARLPPRARIIALATPVVVVSVYFAWRALFGAYEALPRDEPNLGSSVGRLGPPIEMLGSLLAVGISSIFRGYDFTPLGYPTVQWWLVVAYWSLAWTAFVVGNPALRRRMIALFLMALAVYGMIALGRANVYLMFGTKPAEAARELRYHYVGSIFVVMAFMLALARVMQWKPLIDLPGALLGSWALWNAYFYAGNEWTLKTHADCRVHVNRMIQEIDSVLLRQPVGTDVYIRNDELPVYCTFFMGYDSIPGPAAVYVMFHPENDLQGRYPRFVELEPHVGKFDNPRNRRLSQLLVPP